MKMLGDTTGGIIGVLTVIGDRLKLFDTLAADGPLTSDEFAERAGITERYAREWLSRWPVTDTSPTTIFRRPFH